MVLSGGVSTFNVGSIFMIVLYLVIFLGPILFIMIRRGRNDNANKTIVCKNCGQYNSGKGGFCKYCGAELHREVKKKTAKKICPNCGLKTDEGSVFCPNCGKNI